MASEFPQMTVRALRAVSFTTVDGEAVTLEPNQPTTLRGGDAAWAILQAPNDVLVDQPVNLCTGCSVTWGTPEHIQGPGVVWAVARCQGVRWALVCDPVSNRGRLIRADTIVDIQPYQLLRTLTEALIDNHSADSPDSEASAVATGLLRNLLVSRHPGDSLEEHQS